MSAKFNPAALTRTRTCPFDGTGSGRCSTFMTRTSPLVVVTIARKLVEKVSGSNCALPEERLPRFPQLFAGSKPALRLGSIRGLSLFVWLRHEPEVRLDGFPAAREFLFRSFVAERRHDDHVVAVFPIHRRRDTVVRRQLQRINDAQDLIKVATGARRIRNHQLHFLVWSDDEN